MTATFSSWDPLSNAEIEAMLRREAEHESAGYSQVSRALLELRYLRTPAASSPSPAETDPELWNVPCECPSCGHRFTEDFTIPRSASPAPPEGPIPPKPEGERTELVWRALCLRCTDWAMDGATTCGRDACAVPCKNGALHEWSGDHGYSETCTVCGAKTGWLE